MDKDNLTRNAASAMNDTMETAKDLGREGYDNAREYVSRGMDYAGEVSDGMADFVQRHPWLALAGAFVIGYVAAKALRQISL